MRRSLPFARRLRRRVPELIEGGAIGLVVGEKGQREPQRSGPSDGPGAAVDLVSSFPQR